MKRLLLATLTGTLLLGSCGNTSSSEEKKLETSTKEKSNKKEEKEYNKELRNYLGMDLGTYEIMMNYIDSNQDGDADPQDIIDAYKQYSNELNENLKLHQKNIKNIEGKGNEKKINDSFVGINETFSEFLSSLASEMEKYQSETITKDEFNKNIKDIQNKMENKVGKHLSISKDISEEEFKKIIGKKLYDEYDRVFTKFSDDDVTDKSEPKTEVESTEETTTVQPPISEQQGGYDGSQPGWNYDENTGQFTDRDPNFESNMQKEDELFDQLENGDLSQEEYSNKMDELWNQ